MDAVWLKYLPLFCLCPVTSEDRWAQRLLEWRLGGSPSEQEWWTRPNRMQRLPFLRLSILFLPTGAAACPITQGRPRPRHALPSEGSGGQKRTPITRRHNGQWAWHLMWRSGREEWWANDVLTNCAAEEVRRNRNGGPRHEESRERKRALDFGVRRCSASVRSRGFWPGFTFKQLHVFYEIIWSQQTFGQNRKRLSPPRMESNPFSPGQTCDLKPSFLNT